MSPIIAARRSTMLTSKADPHKGKLPNDVRFAQLGNSVTECGNTDRCDRTPSHAQCCLFTERTSENYRTCSARADHRRLR